jgi:putative hemolysin
LHIDDDDFNLSDLMTEAPYMMEQTTAYKALGSFKTTGVHYAMVADEYGIFQVITLNDILEALVGNVSDFIEKSLNW